MVWGLVFPSGFGDGWPDGEFESDPKYNEPGWFGRLKSHYLDQSPEVQRRLYGGQIADHAMGISSYVVGKFTHEVGSRENQHKPPFSPLEEHEPPRFFQTLRKHTDLCSIIKLNCLIPAVDDDLKAIIEHLEPGVHQFYPLEIRLPAKKVYPKNYYTLVVGTFLDSFAFDQTKPGSAHSPSPGRFNLNTTKKAMAGAAFRKVGFAGHHLWRERTFWHNVLCFSEELHDAIVEAGIKMPRKFHQMAEV